MIRHDTASIRRVCRVSARPHEQQTRLPWTSTLTTQVCRAEGHEMQEGKQSPPPSQQQPGQKFFPCHEASRSKRAWPPHPLITSCAVTLMTVSHSGTSGTRAEGESSLGWSKFAASIVTVICTSMQQQGCGRRLEAAKEGVIEQGSPR